MAGKSPYFPTIVVCKIRAAAKRAGLSQLLRGEPTKILRHSYRFWLGTTDAPVAIIKDLMRHRGSSPRKRGKLSAAVKKGCPRNGGPLGKGEEGREESSLPKSSACDYSSLVATPLSASGARFVNRIRIVPLPSSSVRPNASS
jgi:hypothetical protein